MRCLIVDDNAQFLESASRLLERQGIEVVGAASTSAEALELFEDRRPDVTLVDVFLGSESGFDVVEQIAGPTILISTHGAEDLAPLMEASPAVGFVSKAEISAEGIRRLVEGERLVHEAFVYSTPAEFVAAIAPFAQDGIDAGEPVFIVTKDANQRLLREALGPDAGRAEWVDSSSWYTSPEEASEKYWRHISDKLADGAELVRILGEPVWPSGSSRAVAAWKRYESALNDSFASLPAWIVCPYDAGELATDIVADAERTHPRLRCAHRAFPSARYVEPHAFALEIGGSAKAG